MKKLSGEVTDSGRKETQGKRRDSSGGASFSGSFSAQLLREELRQHSAHLRNFLQALGSTDRPVTEE